MKCSPDSNTCPGGQCAREKTFRVFSWQKPEQVPFFKFIVQCNVNHSDKLPGNRRVTSKIVSSLLLISFDKFLELFISRSHDNVKFSRFAPA